jgi:NTE family protein
MMPKQPRLHDASEKPRRVLVLQGGGALGSYQGGVFEALAEANEQPSWVAGVSIGAINAALIAGNPPEKRVERLRQFWARITEPTALWPNLPLPGGTSVGQKLGAASALLFGQTGFFRPRAPLTWLSAPPPVSYYDTSDLRSTLESLVDFDRINAGYTRLSVGAVQVETGNMVYFDSAVTKITPAHVMASGALPPGFEGVAVDGAIYWDGGLVSNTPLQFVMAEKPRHHSLIFQVDLFPSRGPVPKTLDEVAERAMDIRFSSRTRTGTSESAERQNMRRQVRRFLEMLPQDLRDDPVVAEMREFACSALIDVVHLIYRPDEPQGSQKDFQFDRGTMERRWAAGLADARVSLAAAPWEKPANGDVGFRTFDQFRPPHAKRVRGGSPVG